MLAITNSSFSELVEMDKTYLSRLALRKQIIQDHNPIVIQAAPSMKPAVDELYTWLISIYLPTRFPTMFTLSATSLLNCVTSEFLPRIPPADPVKALEILGGNIDDEFLLLVPSEDGDGYVLKGFVTCFPAGFNTKEKFGLKLRDIHKPVPGYKDKLGKSMDRFFDKIEVGRIVLRSNVSVTVHPNCCDSGNMLTIESGLLQLMVGYMQLVAETIFTKGRKLWKKKLISIMYVKTCLSNHLKLIMVQTWLRTERQMLHRLPQTKALVFSFKTYLYSLKDIKDEGLGEELAQAIDGLKEGSVPAMHFYKRGIVWGEEVKRYLRSKDDVS